MPDYPIGCKRLLFSNDWYPALAREHVEVVTERVTALEPGGVRTADGTLHEADVLIWGTGFAATEFLRRCGSPGVGGADLHETWRDGARAHLGLSVPGFPNLFCVYGPNTNLGGSSIIAMMEAQAGYIGQVAQPDRRRRATAWSTSARTRPRPTTPRSRAGCPAAPGRAATRWYVDGGRITTNWPGLVTEYQQRTATVDWSELDARVGSEAVRESLRGQSRALTRPSASSRCSEQVRGVAVDGDRPGVQQLGPPVAAAEQAHRGHALLVAAA